MDLGNHKPLEVEEIRNPNIGRSVRLGPIRNKFEFLKFKFLKLLFVWSI